MGIMRLSRAEREAADRIVKQYKLKPGLIHGNEERAFEGKVGKDAIRLAVYDSFITVDVGLGGAYHAAVPNRMPFGKEGHFQASSSPWQWRGILVAPMCRTAVGEERKPPLSDDIVALARSLREEAMKAKAARGDLSLMDRNITRPGWGKRGERLYRYEDTMPSRPAKGVPRPRISR